MVSAWFPEIYVGPPVCLLPVYICLSPRGISNQLMFPPVKPRHRWQATDLGWAPISSALIFYLYGNSIFAGEAPKGYSNAS